MDRSDRDLGAGTEVRRYFAVYDIARNQLSLAGPAATQSVRRGRGSFCRKFFRILVVHAIRPVAPIQDFDVAVFLRDHIDGERPYGRRGAAEFADPGLPARGNVVRLGTRFESRSGLRGEMGERTKDGQCDSSKNRKPDGPSGLLRSRVTHERRKLLMVGQKHQETKDEVI